MLSAVLPLSQNGRAFLATTGLAVAYLGFCGTVGKRALPPRLARKLMHIGTGPLYMLCWPLFSAHSPWSRWVCAAVPALAGVQFALVGSGVVRSGTLVAGASRTGQRQELLKGPLYYAIVHVAVTLLCWRHSPSGILALSVLCGGDGLAEVVGASRLGARTPRLPHSPRKTLAGSLACWLGGAATALPLLVFFRRQGLFAGGMAATAASSAAASGGGAAGAAAAGAAAGAAASRLHGWPLLAGVLLCSAVGAAVESAPVQEVDNFTVVATVAAAARWYFGF